MEQNVCTRCHGEGYIKSFAHVVQGVCFRCWGTGEDPQEMYELRRWVANARDGYRILRAEHAVAKGAEKAQLQRQMDKLSQVGKEKAAQLKKLETRYDAARETVRALYKSKSV